MAIGAVLWITGLSGAGKSTLAREMTERLRARGRTVILLDGDELREVLGASCGPGEHTRERRLELAMRYGRLCGLIAGQGATVIIATISMFREVHTWNRGNLPGYYEVFLRVPLDVLRRRDPKGIYRRFDQGELTDIAGLDMRIDEPEQSDWVVSYAPERNCASLADVLMERLDARKF